MLALILFPVPLLPTSAELATSRYNFTTEKKKARFYAIAQVHITLFTAYSNVKYTEYNIRNDVIPNFAEFVF
jgi:hypothetical protein